MTTRGRMCTRTGAAAASVATLLILSVGAALTRTVIDPIQRSAHGATHRTAHQTNLAQSPDMLSARLALSHMPAGSPTVRYSGARSVGEGVRTGGNGFWAAYPNGTVVADSPAPVLGDMSGTQLTRPIVGAVPTPSSNGYWLVASDGGIFTFGDAGFYGSTGAERLNQPVVGMASTPDGRGYWLVASDGGIFTFGDAGFYGSTGAERLNQPVSGMATTPDSRGYWLVARDGGVFTFGDAQFHGSAANNFPANGQHAVGVTSAGNGGYWLATDTGSVASMDAPLTASSNGSGPSGSSQLPPNQDPAQSMPPSGDFYSACFSNSYSASACDKSALSNIDSALSGEGYGPLSLPSNYSSLSTIAQLVAVANAERAVRRLPQMPENSNLDSMAYNGARNNTDPTGPAGYTWGSNLAMGYPTALSADYVWMYDDGSNSPNVDCQSAGDPGCWGHRHNILIQGGGESGGGVYNDNGTLNLTQLFVVNYR
jgi:hypothetical protein